MKHNRMGMLVVVVTMVAAAGLSEGRANARSTTGAARVEFDAEAALQGARRAHGASTLISDGAIARVAQAHAVRMSRSGDIFHNRAILAELDAAGVARELVGENVGAGPGADDVHHAFMASPPHKHNILDRRYTSVGVGAQRGIDGRIYIVEIFVRTKTTKTRTQPATMIRAEDGSLVPPSFYGDLFIRDR